ncbi:MAG: hypothetical protein ACOC9W_01585 [Persicimonas sp.]
MSDETSHNETTQHGASSNETAGDAGQTHWAHTRAEGHHSMPQSGGPTIADWTVVVVSVVIVAVSIVLSIRYLFRPGEQDPDHIKRRILREEGGPDE